MTFTKFTHTLLKHCQASRGHNMKCMKKKNWMIIYMRMLSFGKDFSFMVNFMNSSKSETQHVIHKIYSHTRHWNTTKQVEDPTWSAQNVNENANVDFQK